jgi:CheY-like chemotaxis protein
MEALGQFAGGLAHDFNNLLTVINGYTFLMLKGLIPEHPMRAELEAVLQAGKHAAVLTSQFLAFSRRQILQPKMVDLNKVVTGNQPMLRRLIGEQIELSANLDPALGVVEADPVQLEQVIMNLASNARDAMPLGGKLILETSNVFVDKEQYSGSPLEVPPGSYALLTVRDTGTGMSEDVKSRIFEPFFTTKERGKGTGLGLSTAYGTVKQSGGHIVVDSKPGSGTIFKIYLPTATVAETAAESQQQERPFLNGTEVVLVAEDEKDVRKLICESLRTFGYRVLEAGDGAEVLSVCEWQKGPIQLLVTDVVMPGMPVSEMVSQIRRVRPETKVLYMSGYMDDVVLGSLGPGTSFLQKPFTPEVLAARIRELLTAPREDNTDNRSMEHKT